MRKTKEKEIFSSQSSTINKIKMIQNCEMILYNTILEYVGEKYFGFDNKNTFIYCTMDLDSVPEDSMGSTRSFIQCRSFHNTICNTYF